MNLASLLIIWIDIERGRSVCEDTDRGDDEEEFD